MTVIQDEKWIELSVFLQYEMMDKVAICSASFLGEEDAGDAILPATTVQTMPSL